MSMPVSRRVVRSTRPVPSVYLPWLPATCLDWLNELSSDRFANG